MTASPLVRWLAHAVTRLFYRVDCSGHVPSAGPVLLLPNHPNALLDPAIVWATAGRDVRFLAKSTLFQGPLAPVLERAGAIPVYRRLDQGVDLSRNAETFEAVDRALAAGEAICIFPEGVSHSTGRLVPLRTGAARMALSAERRGVAVQLIAVGLNFDRKTAFRSRATVLFGRPFSAGDLAHEDEQSAVRRLTDRIAGEMRRLLVEADPERDEATLRRVERLYAAARGQPGTPEERVRRRQAIASGIEKLRSTDAGRYLDVAMRLQRYDQRLRRFGLRDAHLDQDLSARAAVSFAVREGLVAIGLLPVSVAGLVVFWVPYHLTGLLARRATRERDVTATAKVFVGAAVYAAWLGVIAVAVGALFGMPAGIATAFLLPVLAFAGLFAIEREGAVLETIRAWWTLRRARQRSRAWLKRARSEIAQLLDEAYGWLSEETSAQPGG